jgi:hypothetical protein
VVRVSFLEQEDRGVNDNRNTHNRPEDS